MINNSVAAIQLTRKKLKPYGSVNKYESFGKAYSLLSRTEENGGNRLL
jgi:hypothetical protein